MGQGAPTPGPRSEPRQTPNPHPQREELYIVPLSRQRPLIKATQLTSTRSGFGPRSDWEPELFQEVSHVTEDASWGSLGAEGRGPLLAWEPGHGLPRGLGPGLQPHPCR